MKIYLFLSRRELFFLLAGETVEKEGTSGGFNEDIVTPVARHNIRICEGVA